jgi:hypothetical protein
MGSCLMKKTRGRKSRVRVPFKKFASGPYYLRKNFFYYKNIVYKKISKTNQNRAQKKTFVCGVEIGGRTAAISGPAEHLSI